MLCGVMGGCALYDTPPHAASAKTWTVGSQVWSDAIQIPDCNKSNFRKSPTIPQCRSYTHEGNTYYYYNWPYVNTNANLLCPAPWRVPNIADYVLLADNGKPLFCLLNNWGDTYGGWCDGARSLPESVSTLFYWSTWELNGELAQYAYYYNGALFPQAATLKYYGFQVRCVK